MEKSHNRLLPIVATKIQPKLKGLVDMSDLEETAEYLLVCHPHNVIPAISQLSKHFNMCYTKKDVATKLYEVFTKRLRHANDPSEKYYWTCQLAVVLKNM